MIKEYKTHIIGKCSLCGDEDIVVIDEDGEEMCPDCLFERTCDKEYTN